MCNRVMTKGVLKQENTSASAADTADRDDFISDLHTASHGVHFFFSLLLRSDQQEVHYRDQDD